jgi:hypothetical protein
LGFSKESKKYRIAGALLGALMKNENERTRKR